MNRNVVVDQRSSFIAEYAAKRQHQLERAKQLREQRVSSTNSGSAGGSGGSDDLPARPQNIRTSSFQQQQQQQQQSTQSYTNESGSRTHQSNAPIDYPPPIARGGGDAAPTLSRLHSIEVTEHHFREATQRGIITPDQARQLWAVLSDQATMVAPLTAGGGKPSYQGQGAKGSSSAYNPNHYAVPLNEQHSNVSPSSGGATYRGSFAHQLALGSTTSPLDADEHAPSGGEYGQPSKVSKSLAARVGGATPSTNARKPEWNSDFTGAQDDYEYDSAPRREQGPTTAARNPTTNARDAGKRRPEWNDDPASTYAEPEPPAAPKSTPKVAGGAVGGRSRRREDEDVTPLDQVMPPKQQPASRQGKPQQPTQRAATNARVGGSRQQQPPPPPEPTGPVEQSPEEIAEFLRQKEDARRQFEEALEEADTREPLVPCRVCARNFRESVIDRHENACKVANKKRRAFDSKANRLQGIDGIDEVMTQQPSRRGTRQQQAAPASRGTGGGGGDKPVPQRQTMPKWKLQHEQFQVALAAIRHAANPQSSAPPPPMPEALDDRVPCPHCSRRFQAETAARHIPNCAKTINKPKGLVRPGQAQMGRR